MCSAMNRGKYVPIFIAFHIALSMLPLPALQKKLARLALALAILNDTSPAGEYK